MDKLLPCPFCGSKAEFRREHDMDSSETWIKCSGCPIKTVAGVWLGDDAKVVETLTKIWNTRAATPTPGAWLPIESAPKDGTKFIVYGHPFGFRSIWITNGTIDLDIATHWMPLPLPPEQAGGKVES